MFRRFRKFLCNKQKKNKKCLINQRIYTRELINEINYTEMLEQLKQGAKLIDVRTKQEYNEGHFDNAILIPYFEIAKNIKSIIPNQEQEIIVYCENGGRSRKAYKTLNNMGYNNIYNLKGGRKEVL